MRKLEAKIVAPHAESARITEVISRIQSNTVDAPRNLSVALLARSDDIAQAISGQVPLHGPCVWRSAAHVPSLDMAPAAEVSANLGHINTVVN